MQECRQTRDRTNGHLVDSNISKFYDSLNIVVIMQKMNQKVLL